MKKLSITSSTTTFRGRSIGCNVINNSTMSLSERTTHCMSLVNDQSSGESRSRRTKSDSEIKFSSLDRQSNLRLTSVRGASSYNTLKTTKNQSSAHLRTGTKHSELRRSYDGRRKSTLKSYQTNTVPRRTHCIAADEVTTKEQRSNSLPANIKLSCQIINQQQPVSFELHITAPPTTANETENRRTTTTNPPAAPDCGVDDRFVFEAVLAQQQDNVDMNRPRQYGRRLNTSINSISPNNTSSSSSNESYECSQIANRHNNCDDETIENSAILDCMENSNSNSDSLSSTTIESSSAANRQNNSASTTSSPPSSSFLAQSPRLESIIRELGPRFCQTDRNNNNNAADDGWPISISRPITCLFCCMGMFNFLRFAVSTIIYGGNFLIQFLLLSLLFGIPFVTLQMVLGQRIRKGVVTLFRISPICKGIGISLIISHCILCLYSAVSIGWMMIYLR